MRLLALLASASLLVSTSAFAQVSDAAVERTGDTLTVTWKASPNAAVDVLVAERPDAPASALKLVSNDDRDGRHTLAAPASRRLYVTLRGAKGETLHVAERVLPVEGVQNFRDVGGYRTIDGRRVRWGVIYRSAGLSQIAPGEADELGSLGIRTVHDLRSKGERANEPTRWPGAGQPIIKARDYDMDMSGFAKAFAGGINETKARQTFAAFYPGILDSHREQFRELFQTLLSAEGPVLYHCSAGKDRTGVATGLVLTALGVPRETVLADYALSNRYYRMNLSPAANRAPTAEMRMFASLPPEVVKVFQGVEPEYLEAVFDEIDRRHGGFDVYLQKELGVGPAELAKLKATYLEQ
ncbi:tyrosine-protein phosphatase [Phenylobacterium deserti]|uniref:Protein-tyrosine-phosphatase n=1 Tax=Phenylobacterium deserti TaxID=1914756 RepID=A0A328ADD8_9CAUL|nr:tyrosine-protein phosphatase [Phenylobacterium deserti]RAK52661.1 protein-tyrosine-phosphatase [Phenylobacterium deserti]